jgi:hypothetical protein
MNPLVQGLLGNLNQQAGMPSGGLLGGGMPSHSLLGYQPFRPQFDMSMFQRTPYQPQRFAAPNIQPAPQQQQAAPQQSLPTNPFMGSPISPQQAAQLAAYSTPASYKGMSVPEMYYAMTAGA